MVYSGKPSTGCGRCKERRKKCDETRPYCINCQKIGQECPGFPDQLDLMFKNETDSVTRKATQPHRRLRKQRKPSVGGSRKGLKKEDDEDLDSAEKDEQTKGTTSTPDPFEKLDWLGDWDPTSNLTFNPSIEQQVTTFFFDNFILRPQSKDSSRGFLVLLIPMYEATYADSPLQMATEALAVRTAANFKGGRHLLAHAENLYGQALRAVQGALRDPETATSDETLLCILLFAVYESVTTSSIENWSKHVQGAVSIVRSRGIDQFADKRSLLLFRATRTQMLSDAIQRREAIEDFPGPKDWLSDQTRRSNSCLMKHAIQLPNILARAKNLLILDKTPESEDEVNDLLQDAYTLQQELSKWDLNIPAHYGYKSLFHSGELSDVELLQSEVWRPGPIHLYENVKISIIRNNNRVSQLLCSSVVIDCLKWLDPEGLTEERRYRAAAYRVQYLVDDIAASVPFHLGYRLAGEVPQPENSEIPKQAISSSGAYFLIWPLYTASQMYEVPERQRRWLKAKLRLIARRYGLDQADIARVRAGGLWDGESAEEIIEART